MVEELKNAAAARNFRALIDLTSGSNHSTLNGIWAASITALYGPIGLHKDWTDENDHPTAEAKAKFPHIVETMARAEEKIGHLVESYARHN